MQKHTEMRFVKYRAELNRTTFDATAQGSDEDEVLYQNDSDDETGLTDSDDDEIDEMEEQLCQEIEREFTPDRGERFVGAMTPARVSAQV